MVYHELESKKSNDILAEETLQKKQVEQAVEIHVTVSRKYFRPTAKTRRQSDVTRKRTQNHSMVLSVLAVLANRLRCVLSAHAGGC